MLETEKTNGVMVPRDENGRFLTGVSGNPAGRPKGSKNQITQHKLALEEATRELNQYKMQMVLNMVIDQALSGNENCQRLIWDAVMSKAARLDSEDAKVPSIKIGTMHVEGPAKNKGFGDVLDVTPIEEDSDA
jgi:hypothetical protein